MSDRSASTRANTNRRSRSFRLPIWVPPLLLVISGIVGLLFAIPAGSIGLPYLIAFAVAAIGGTMVVVPRGLTITVAQQPVLFTIITPLVSWFTAEFAHQSVGGATATTPSTTRLITAAYPVVQYFPWMIMIPLICTAIAIWRYLDLTRVNAKTDRLRRKESRRRAEVDAETTRTATEAHRRLSESDKRRRRRPAHAASKERDDESAVKKQSASDLIKAAEKRRLAKAAEAEETRKAGGRRAAQPKRSTEPRRGADRRREAEPRRVAERRRETERREPRRATEPRRVGTVGSVGPAAAATGAGAAAARHAATGRPQRRVTDRPAAKRPRNDDRLIASARPADGPRLWGSDTDSSTPRTRPSQSSPYAGTARRRSSAGQGAQQVRREAQRRTAQQRRPSGQSTAYGEHGVTTNRREASPRPVQPRRVEEWPPRYERPRHAARHSRDRDPRRRDR